MDVPQPTGLERAVLTGPDMVARTAALTVEAPEQRWLLRQPRAVRRSFVELVVDAEGDPHAAERWMLGQSATVSSSYVAEVLDAGR
jgi:hypothetical protein